MTGPANPAEGLRVADFHFHLPEELIAQQPPEERGASRMLIVDRDVAHSKVELGLNSVDCASQPDEASAPEACPPQHWRDASFADLPSLLNSGDLLVLNDSRVIPARLFGRRANTRGKQEPSGLIEVFLTAPDAEGNPHATVWRSLVRPGRKVRIGDHLEFPSSTGAIALHAEVISGGDFGERTLLFSPVNDFYATLEQIGHMPLPPYIKREDATADRERYQTVFAAQRGSVAAPTAGLHFTPSVLEAIEARGVEIVKITLHVGLGTFAPLRVERLDEIHLHTERYTLSAATADALNSAHAAGRRIIAVGTTTVRTLEHCALAAQNQPLQPHSGETSIFISPGYEFRLVNAMLTNFHLPQSSLLMLVSAFAGRERILAAYNHAVHRRYRFFSYGDCMFIR